MFTWEEAGLLRQMLLAVVWFVLLLVLAVVLVVEREPLASAVYAGAHRVDTMLHPHGHHPN
jgi:hypothetical protein